jgi:hypothetical protein
MGIKLDLKSKFSWQTPYLPPIRRLIAVLFRNYRGVYPNQYFSAKPKFNLYIEGV